MGKFCLKINSICQSFLQGVIASEMPKMLLFTTQRTLGPTLYLYMNLWLEFDNCHSVVLMVIALHRHRKVAALIPAGKPIVTFFLQLA